MAHDPHVQEAAGFVISATLDGYIELEDGDGWLITLTPSDVDQFCAALQYCKEQALKIDMKH